MLILSRKKNESVVINEETTVTIVEMRGDKVRLGIEVPKGGSVHRKELIEALHEVQHQNGVPVLEMNPLREITLLKQELASSQRQAKQYRQLLQQFLQEEWRGVSRDDLDQAFGKSSTLQEILEELEQGTHA
jgi:carbon storage regulator